MAGSPNAFAAGTSTGSRRSSILTEQDHNARPTKRARLSDEAVASISTQCARADTSLEVDYMILDYVAYQTINACFASRKLDQSNGSPYSLSKNLAISGALLSIFRVRYPEHQPDPELRLRILLLRLTTLFTQRLTSNPTTPPRSIIEDLRITNMERARVWMSKSGSRPTSIAHTFDAFDMIDQHQTPSRQELDRNRAHVLHELRIPAEDEDYEDAFYGTSSCIGLLDLLPLFMEVSATRSSMSDSNLTQQWMKLACEFMLQSCLEQYLVFGSPGSSALDEAFAWGYVDQPQQDVEVNGTGGAMDISSGVDVYAMFEDEDYEIEVDGWKEMRQSYIDELIPMPNYISEDTVGDAFVTHLEAAASMHSIAAFESALLKFLEAISKSLPAPVLIQLENGKLDGMTEQETQDFLIECGVSVARFFEHPAGFKDGVD